MRKVRVCLTLWGGVFIGASARGLAAARVLGLLDQVAGGRRAVLPALRYWRVQRALKQTELAENAGIHWTTVQRIERGQQAEVETISKLAAALRVAPDELMREPSAD